MIKREYLKPAISTELSFESSCLACGKTVDYPPGSWHFTNAYDTFTGHFGPAMGVSESESGSVGLSAGPATSTSYGYAGLCTNWVTFTS